MNEYTDKLLDHDYDGIKELDNDLPRWWVALFWVTIIWGLLYLMYYHLFGIGLSSSEEYLAEVDPTFVRTGQAEYKLLGFMDEYHSPFFTPGSDLTPKLRATKLGLDQIVEEVTAEEDTTTYLPVSETADITEGRKIFAKNCVPCHGKLGEGGIGPNLTDDYWLHGASFTQMVKSIKYGYPAKGMIPWRGFLTDEKILQVASFVDNLRGTNPPNAKSPQGDPYTE